jgi:hypothetical protein
VKESSPIAAKRRPYLNERARRAIVSRLSWLVVAENYIRTIRRPRPWPVATPRGDERAALMAPEDAA